MIANRQDAWTPDDDMLLAEVTLRHIREGSTQLAAFDEVAERLGRSSAACGFRWNSTVRKKYEAAIAIAKAQRQKNRANRNYTNRRKEVELTESHELEEVSLQDQVDFDTMIRFLKSQKTSVQTLTRQVRTYEKEIKEKDEELKNLRSEIEKMKHHYSSAQTINDDYRVLLQIMDRARKMELLGSTQEETPVFKMDANGNLERMS